MPTKREKVIIQTERQEVLNAHYDAYLSKEKIDHITKKLKQGIDHASFEKTGRSPHMGVKGLHELVWAIGRKANGL